MTNQRFSPYGEGMSRKHKDLDQGLTTVQLSKDDDARLIAHVAFRHGQELGSVLNDQRPFDLLPIMRRRTSWSCKWLLS